MSHGSRCDSLKNSWEKYQTYQTRPCSCAGPASGPSHCASSVHQRSTTTTSEAMDSEDENPALGVQLRLGGLTLHSRVSPVSLPKDQTISPTRTLIRRNT